MAEKTYFFDVSDIYIYLKGETTVSGIQRVFFEVVARAIDILGVENIYLTYLEPRTKEYVAVSATHFSPGTSLTPALFSQVFFGNRARSVEQTAPTLTRYRHKPLKYRYHWLVRSYHAWKGNEAYFQKKGSSLAEWRAFTTESGTADTFPNADLSPVPVHTCIAEHDHLILLGGLWDVEGLYEQIESLKNKKNIEISQLIHDLIPLLLPEHLGYKFSLKFYYWLEISAKLCTNFLANSQNTAKDLHHFLQEIEQIKPIHVVPLAQKFSLPQTKFINCQTTTDSPTKSYLKETQEIDLDILNLTKIPYVLVVGTIETRKNAWRLAQAWKRLTEQTDIEVPRLVFAGKPGWLNIEFEQLMDATQQLGGWVQFVRNPSDIELQFLYQHCQFTAMVSIYEGWGLPVGEGLSFGKTGIVGDNSSLPEVGGDLVEYCNAQSINSIYEASRQLIENSTHRKQLEAKIAATRLRSWDDVVKDLLIALSHEEQSE